MMICSIQFYYRFVLCLQNYVIQHNLLNICICVMVHSRKLLINSCSIFSSTLLELTGVVILIILLMSRLFIFLLNSFLIFNDVDLIMMLVLLQKNNKKFYKIKGKEILVYTRLSQRDLFMKFLSFFSFNSDTFTLHS